MDDVITFADERATREPAGTPWKILIADDEPSMHLVTKLALGDFMFEGRPLELLSAFGEDDTRRLLSEHPDIALILLDVIMDTTDSGFTLVRYIRDTLANKEIRIIMRTGQSGNAPEDRIIISYDINDFKDKTELTVAKLRTTMISSLRTYSHLKIIAEEQRKSSANRAYLHGIIDSLSCVLFTLDPTLKVRLWNREAERWTGVSAESAAGRDLLEAAPLFAPLKPLLLEVRHEGRVEHPVELPSGKRAVVHLLLQELPGSDGPEILVRLDQSSG
jgi:PAS domain-containing protein